MCYRPQFVRLNCIGRLKGNLVLPDGHVEAEKRLEWLQALSSGLQLRGDLLMSVGQVIGQFDHSRAVIQTKGNPFPVAFVYGVPEMFVHRTSSAAGNAKADAFAKEAVQLDLDVGFWGFKATVSSAKSAIVIYGEAVERGAFDLLNKIPESDFEVVIVSGRSEVQSRSLSGDGRRFYGVGAPCGAGSIQTTPEIRDAGFSGVYSS